MKPTITRRGFVRDTVAATAGAALLGAVGGKAAGQSATDPAPAGPAPAPGPGSDLSRGRIGKLEISRILLGGNLLTHYTHSRDLSYVYQLAARYNTEAKVLETLAVAESHGVNTLVIHTVPEHLAVLRKHRRERGGKIQWIICPTSPLIDGMKHYEAQVARLVDDGTEAIYLWGVRGDELAKAKQVDQIGKAVEIAKSRGVPSGVGAHDLDAIRLCEENKIPADFYIKTLHHHDYPSVKLNHDSMWCKNPEETIAFMQTVEKPWFAFKVMAAGAIPPENAFPYAFRSGADFVLAGMFDFEIEEDVRIAREALAAAKGRPRPWRA